MASGDSRLGDGRLGDGRTVGDRRSIDDVLAEARAALVRVDARRAAELQAAGALLLDIRPHASRLAHGLVPGAVVVERTVLEWRLDPQSDARLEGIDEGTYDRDVVVICNEGFASSLAAADLQRLGLHRATDLIGGFHAWAGAGLPVAPLDAGHDVPGSTSR